MRLIWTMDDVTVMSQAPARLQKQDSEQVLSYSLTTRFSVVELIS